MAEKISEAVWTAFVKKQKLDLEDKDFVKALARFDKAPESKPEQRIEALEQLLEQGRKLSAAVDKRKKELGDKPHAETRKQLAEISEAADRLIKELRTSAAQAGEEEAEEPALLTSKLVPLLREVRQGEVVLQALIAVADKDTAVLLSRRDISPARGKLLKDFLGATGNVRLIRGDARFEENALTFAIEGGGPGGLAKRLKAALLAQTEMRINVRVRGEPEEAGEEEVAADAPAAPVSAAAPPPPPPPPGDRAQAQAYAKRLAEVQKRYDDALRNQHPESTKLRALMGFASEKAGQKGDFAGALKALEMVAALLGQATAAAPPPASSAEAPTTAASTAPDPSAAFKARLTALLAQVSAAAAKGLPQAAEVKLRIAEAGTLARKQDFAGANALLDRVESLLATPAPASDATPAPASAATPGATGLDTAAAASAPDAARKRPGAFARGLFLIQRWPVILNELSTALTELGTGLRAEGVDEDPQELIDALRGYMDGLVATMREDIDTGINRGDMTLIQGLKSRVEADAVVQELFRNPIVQGSRFRSLLIDSLGEVEASLAG